MKAKIIASLKKALVNEIIIDFRACVYFFCVVFFYCAVKACQGVFRVDIITLVQIVLTNYVICYLQTYLFSDFDESDRFGASEISGILTCAFCYTASSLLFGWFGGSEPVTALFALYIIFTYVCVILCHIVRRKLDTKQLNQLLDQYKQNEGSHPHEC